MYWDTATPEEVGLDVLMLDQGSAKLEAQNFSRSLVIIKDDKLVYEKYYHGYNANNIHLIRSVSKSYLSALVGVAVEQNKISLDQIINDFFPDLLNATSNKIKKEITIEHLLKMTAGFGGDRARYIEFTSSENWVSTIINFPLEFDPGEGFLYSTAGTHLLGACLTKAVGTTLNAFAVKNLFEPLGVTIGDWETDPQGFFFGGNNMFFTTRDMAKFGQLFMHKGKLNDQQIVPESWVTNSTSPLRKSTSTWGSINNIGYGMLWWTGNINGYFVYFALGHGGQFIMNVPSKNMIIVVTCNGYVDWDTADTNEQFITEVIATRFLNAFAD